MTENFQGQIKLLIDEWLTQTNGVGVVVGIDSEKSSDFSGGYSDLDKKSLITGDAIFPIFSITKSFIATIVMQLAENSQLKLDDYVSDLIKDTSIDDRITIRQLLNHTSGLPDYGNIEEYKNDVKQKLLPWSKEKFIKIIGDKKLLFEPGQGWAYSNIGYLLLKEIAEKVTGLSFSEYLPKYIFSPLGLKNTFVLNDLKDMQKVTPGYSKLFSGEKMEDVREAYHPGWVSHGVIASTVKEINIFYKSLFGGKLVSEKSLNEMFQSVKVPFNHPYFVTPSYALGLMSDPDSKFGPLFGHGGEGPGYTCLSYHIPNKNVDISIFCNSDVGAKVVDELMFKLFPVIV